MTTETFIDNHLQRLRVWAMQRGFTPRGLAVASGLGVGSLRHMYKDTWNPQADTVRTLEVFAKTLDTALAKKNIVIDSKVARSEIIQSLCDAQKTAAQSKRGRR